MNQPTYEFASPQWLALMHGYLVGRFADLAAELDGDSFRMCEVYTDIPASVNQSDRVAVTWGVEGERLSVSLSESDDVDIKIVADWATLAPLARSMADDLDTDKTQEVLARATAEGRFQADYKGPAPAFLLQFHNAIASITA